MATTFQTPIAQPLNASSAIDHEPPKVTSTKAQAESPNLKAIPSRYTFTIDPNEIVDPNDPEFSIPIVDYSLLTSNFPEQRSKIIHDLSNICQDWGFFLLINHGIPESLKKGMFDAFDKFFKLPDEDKEKLKCNGLFDPVKYGSSFNPEFERVRLWRDYIKIHTHPKFHTLDKPSGFNEFSLEFSNRVREMAINLLKAISEGLGLEADYIYKTTDMEHGLNQLLANYYPPCPQPENVIGIPQHTDHGLITFLMENDVSGLQVQHHGKWVPVHALPNSFLVNLADYMQILTNGKYKSVVHRACVNKKATRMTITVPHGPSLDKSVGPAPELLNMEGHSPIYRTTTYREYIDLQQSAKTHNKPPLERIRL